MASFSKFTRRGKNLPVEVKKKKKKKKKKRKNCHLKMMLICTFKLISIQLTLISPIGHDRVEILLLLGRISYCLISM